MRFFHWPIFCGKQKMCIRENTTQIITFPIVYSSKIFISKSFNIHFSVKLHVFLLWNVSTHICYFLECRASHLNAGTGSPCHQWVLDLHKAGATDIPRGVVNVPELHPTSTATQLCGALVPQGISTGVHPQESITVCPHYLCDKIHWQLLITCRWGGNVWGSCCLIEQIIPSPSFFPFMPEVT